MSEEEKKLTGPSRWLPKRSYDLDFENDFLGTPPSDGDSFLRLNFRQRSATLESNRILKEADKTSAPPSAPPPPSVTTVSKPSSLPAPLMKSKSISEIDISVTAPFGSVESINSLFDEEYSELGESEVRRRHTSHGSTEQLDVDEHQETSIDYLKPGYIAGRMSHSQSVPTSPTNAPPVTVSAPVSTPQSPRVLRRKATPPIHMFFTSMTPYSHQLQLPSTMTTTSTDPVPKTWFYTGKPAYTTPAQDRKDVLAPVVEEGGATAARATAAGEVTPAITAGTTAALPNFGQGRIGHQIQQKKLTAVRHKKTKLKPKASQLREMNCWAPLSM